MKKIITGVLSLLMCFTFIPSASAMDIQQENEVVTNEYDAIKELASNSKSYLAKQGYTDDEINKIKNYKEVFSNHFYDLKKLSDSELIDAEYTEEQIEILRNFSGTEPEIRAVVAKVTLTIPIEYVTWSESQQRTNAKFKVNFSWTQEPVFLTTDIIAVNWNDWTLANYSTNITYRKKVGTASTLSGTATRVYNSGPDSQGTGFKFPMNKSSNNYYAKNGSFTITLYHNHNKKDFSVYAKYGHSQVTASPGVFMPGFGAINFTYGVSTAHEQRNNRVCK